MSREPKKPPQNRSDRKWGRHPLYGKVPLILRTVSSITGKPYEWWQWDPAFKPRLPVGAVEGDVAKQLFCIACHAPKYFYVDETRTCVQCGEGFVFSGDEQKHWYEVLKFNFASVPIRCRDCRRQRRSQRALHNQVADAKRAVEAAPDDPAAHLALARALVENHERTGHGNLNDALAAARKARKLWPQSLEPDLWEGVVHSRAGREAKAHELLERFIEKAQGRLPSLESKARAYL